MRENIIQWWRNTITEEREERRERRERAMRVG